MVKVAPSILSADFIRLGEEIRSVESGDLLHFDVMDGVFVPNISFGLPVIRSVRAFTALPLDVHLMTVRPLELVEKFLDQGADALTLHVESDEPERTERALRLIRARGKKAGLSVKPATPVSALLPFAPLLDLILIMSVEPGFGGQSFMPEALEKIREARRLADSLGTGCQVEVDGGINRETARLCESAGAAILVAGSHVFRAADRAEEIRILRGV